MALVPITTAGDRDRRSPFGQIGERGVFVKELEEALLDGRIDAAVHSAKDMTSTDTAGLDGRRVPAARGRRATRCAAPTRSGPGMRIGTASVRRRAQLLALEPTLSIEPLRGNIDTRLRKRGERGLDAVVLAACGLDRLGLAAEIGLRFDPDEMLPEAGQGALARPGARRRGGARRGGRRRGDSPAGRGGAHVRGRGRRRVPGAGRGPPRRGDARRARRRRGRPLGRAPLGRRPGRARGGARTARVVLTRPEGRNEELAARLRELGHEVAIAPLIAIEPVGSGPVDLDGYDWLVLTSAAGARELKRA